MKITDTTISDVKIIEPPFFGDDRGFFTETWNHRTFADAGMEFNFVQDNHSHSAQGILRGLHYQLEQTQGKLVRVVTGKVFDVAVDLRKNSATFGEWVGVELSDQNHRMLWVPPGFAHGFYVMSKKADFLYKCTDFYAPEHERCIRWDDAEIGIEWPLVSGKQPLVSDKDAAGISLSAAEVF